MAFLFKVGAVPFKFLRGNPDHSVDRHRTAKETEAQARLDIFPEPEFHDL